MDLFETFCPGIFNLLDEYECNRRHEITTQIVPVPVPILYCGVAKLTDLMCLGLHSLHEPVNKVVRLLREGLFSSFCIHEQDVLSSLCINEQDVDRNAANLLTDYMQHTATPQETIPKVEDPKVLESNYTSFGDGMHSASTNLMLDKGSEYWNGVAHAMTEEKVRDLVLLFQAKLDWALNG